MGIEAATLGAYAAVAAAVASVGSAIYQGVSASGKKEEAAPQQEMKGPEAPDPKVAAEASRKEMMRKRALLTKTNLSQANLATGADVGKKVLLGG